MRFEPARNRIVRSYRETWMLGPKDDMFKKLDSPLWIFTARIGGFEVTQLARCSVGSNLEEKVVIVEIVGIQRFLIQSGNPVVMRERAKELARGIHIPNRHSQQTFPT